jgi:hypothetical protein
MTRCRQFFGDLIPEIAGCVAKDVTQQVNTLIHQSSSVTPSVRTHPRQDQIRGGQGVIDPLKSVVGTQH